MKANITNLKKNSDGSTRVDCNFKQRNSNDTLWSPSLEELGNIIHSTVRSDNKKYPKSHQIGGIMNLHYLYRRARGEKHEDIWADYFKSVEEQKTLEWFIIDMKQRLIQIDVKE